MKSAIRLTLVVAVVATMAMDASAALSQKYLDFGNGPATWLMTKDEHSRWRSISNDTDAQAFIDLFWARRDPTTTTAANEFRDEFDSRVAYANQRFTSGRKAGAMTELGHVLIVLGPPTKITKSDPTKMNAQPSSSGSGEAAAPKGGPVGAAPDAFANAASGVDNASDAVSGTQARQLWTWDRSKTTLPLESPTFEIGFTDQFGDGKWQIARGKFDVSGMLNKMVQASLVNPTLTEVPKYGQVQRTTTTSTSTTTTVTTPVAAPGLPALKTAAFQAAIDARRAGTSTLPATSSVVYTQLVAPGGDFYVPLGVYLPKSANMTADAADTLFGVVQDSTGKVVTSFEEPAKVFNSNGDLLADESVSLPSGKYTAVVGLAKSGVPVAIATKDLDITALGKDDVGVSKMILSNNLAETPDAAPVKSPFAFGKLKVVPKGNLVFGSKDDLSYFIELHNPGIDPATNLPKLQSKLEISGSKLKQAISAPLTDALALPLSGAPGPGQYAIANAIPLGAMTTPLAPGDYSLKVKLIDTVTKQSYNVEQSFKIE